MNCEIFRTLAIVVVVHCCFFPNFGATTEYRARIKAILFSGSFGSAVAKRTRNYLCDVKGRLGSCKGIIVYNICLTSRSNSVSDGATNKSVHCLISYREGLGSTAVRYTIHFFVNFNIFKWLYLAYYWVYLHQTWGFCKSRCVLSDYVDQ